MALIDKTDHATHFLNNLSILVAAYLLYKGFFRMMAALSVDFPQAKLTILGGVISVVLGAMVCYRVVVSGFLPQL